MAAIPQQLRQEAARLLAERDALAARCAAEGTLDEQFAQLLSLQDETNPDFVLEVVNLYFDDSAQKAHRIAALVGLVQDGGGGGGAAPAAAPAPFEPDYGQLDALAHQFKGSSASLGARQVALACSLLRDACQARDLAAAQAGARQVAAALADARARLEAVAAVETRRKEVEQQALAAAGGAGGGGGGC